MSAPEEIGGVVEVTWPMSVNDGTAESSVVRTSVTVTDSPGRSVPMSAVATPPVNVTGMLIDEVEPELKVARNGMVSLKTTPVSATE